MLLEHPDLRMNGEFCSSIFDEDYFYFSRLYDIAYESELTKLAYHVRQASTHLVFCAADWKRFSFLVIYVKKGKG